MVGRRIDQVFAAGLCMVVLGGAPALGAERVSASQKGSLLVFPKVELRWDANGTLLQDTFIDLTNDYPGHVLVQMYFVNGDQVPINPWVDVQIALTANEPTFWSVCTGLPKGVSPFEILGPPIPDPEGSGGSVLRGYILAWAVNSTGEQIRWNHLKGDVLIVNYADGAAWEYSAYAFQVNDPVLHGSVVGDPGVLRLNGVEYDNSFDLLLLDFYASNSTALSSAEPGGAVVSVDTDLTLLPMDIDLRQETNGPVTTKAKFDIWNMNEVKFSGTERCITCWDQTLLSWYDPPNHFLRGNLQTDKGKARIDGVASQVCNTFDDQGNPDVVSVGTPLLGVAMKLLTFNSGANFAMAGSNLVGMGDQAAVIRADTSSIPPELNAPANTALAPSLQTHAMGFEK
jgi:hypothetical protein